MSNEIKVDATSAELTESGRCNACQGKSAPSQRVWLIGVRLTELVLCDTCAVELADKLQSAFRKT